MKRFIIFLLLSVVNTLFACSSDGIDNKDIYDNSGEIGNIDTIVSIGGKDYFKDSLANNGKNEITLPGFTNPTPNFVDKYPGREDIFDDSDEVCEIDSLIYGAWKATQIVDLYKASDTIIVSDTILDEDYSFILSIYEESFSLEYADIDTTIALNGCWNYYGETIEFVCNSENSWSDTYIFNILSLSEAQFELLYLHPYMIGDTIPQKESEITLIRQ